MAKIEKKPKSKIKVISIAVNNGNTPITRILSRKKKKSVKQIP